jgi:hypothetical protein
MPAVLIADREPVQQIFDGLEADATEIGRAARTDAFEILKRPLQRVWLRQV